VIPRSAAIEPNPLFHAFFDVEPQLREQYLRLSSVPRTEAGPAESPARLIEQTACFLELLLVSSFLCESLVARGLSPADVTPDLVAEIRELSITMYGLDPVVVLDTARRHLEITATGKEEFELSLEAIVRALSSFLEACPIEHLEQLAATYRLEAFGHRCRVAYDGIRAFVLRNDPSQKLQIRVLGQAYARGSLSVVDVATLLELHPVDAVALLESQGFKRGLDRISLDDAGRAEIFARMRQDRLDRAGTPAWSPESIARDVVASERIEGVDARRWIPRDGQ